jgi:hypothetical protein
MKDTRPFHEAQVRTNPEWGWRGQRSAHVSEMPDAGRPFELFHARGPDEAPRQRILVANPVKLYGFA